MITFDLRNIVLKVSGDTTLSDTESQEIADSLSLEELETRLIDDVIEAVPAKYRSRVELEISL